MLIIEILVGGFLSSFAAGDSCIDALHQLRSEERLQVVSTDVLEDNVLAFTLSDSPRIGEKTAILICQRAVDDGAEDPAIVDEPVDDAGVVDDAPIEETGEPIGETDATGEPTGPTEESVVE
jgi:hypothetical protein